MSAAGLIVELARRGVRLWVEDGRLRFKAPDAEAFPEPLRDRVRAHRTEILALLTRTGTAAPAPVPVADPHRVAPASFEQRRFLLLDRLFGAGAAYNLSSAFLLEGALDRTALQAAAEDVVARHEVLRTRFEERDDGFVQMARPIDLPFDVHAAERLADGDDPQTWLRAVLAHVRAAGAEPFDLMAGPHARLALYIQDDRRHVLAVHLHHIVSDDQSIAVFVADLQAAYARRTAGVDGTKARVRTGAKMGAKAGTKRAAETAAPEAMAPLLRQYRDYACWQSDRAAGADQEAMEQAWCEALDGFTPRLALRLPRPGRDADAGPFAGLVVEAALDPTALDRARRALADRGRFTDFHLLLGAYALTLWAYSRQDDMTVGTPVSMRRDAHLDRTIGPFLNAVPLRLRLDPQQTVAELLERVRQATVAGLARADVPAERLVDLVRPARAEPHMPLFEALFALEDTAVGLMALPGLTIETLTVDNPAAKYTLALFVQHRGGRPVAVLKGRRDRIAEPAARALLDAFVATVATLAGRVGQPVADAAPGTGVEDDPGAAALIGAPAPPPTTLQGLVAPAVNRHGARLAVDDGERALTYAQLDRAAADLCAALGAAGVRPGDRVVVRLARSALSVVAVLGVLRAGAVYVPVEPELPADRQRHMVQAVGARWAVTEPDPAADLGAVPGFEAVTWVPVDAGGGLDRSPAAPAAPPPADVSPDAPCCIFFTSGSTGRPKPVLLSHRAMANNLLWMQDRWPLTPDDLLCLKAPLGFDVSLKEIVWPLMAGACVVPAAPGAHRDPVALRRLIVERGITVIHLVPGMLDHVLAAGAADLDTLRLVMCGGEALTPDLKTRFFDRLGAELLHLYGPTEAAIAVTGVSLDRAGPVHLGAPTHGVRLMVLDDAGREMPPLGVGELCIAGVALAEGYEGDPALTAARFRPVPEGADPGARLYRTGDRVWRDEVGRLIYAGRVDRQVKIGGVRIEPGEVEAALRAHPRVAAAAVAADGEGRGLDAWLVAEAGPRPSQDQVAAFVADRLPLAMVPRRLFWRDRLPLSANGKVDLAALAADVRSPRPHAGVPRSGLVATLTEVWRTVLGHDGFTEHSRFFEVGGTSAHLMQVQRRLSARLGRTVPVADFFDHPTIADLAHHWQGMADDGPGGDAKAGEAAATEGAAPACAATGGALAVADTGRPPVAITGYAGRFPGSADADAFWDHLCAGRVLIETLDDDRLRAAGATAEEIAAPDYVKARGLLIGFEALDAAAFGLTPREAEMLDPQNRLLFELCEEALAHAGLDPGGPETGRVGVFMSVSRSSFFLNLLAGVPDLYARYGPQQVAIATDKSFAATQIAYRFGLTGPAQTVDTACSSALVALHAARRAIEAGECDAALVGAASVDVPAVRGYVYQEGNIAARSGRCRPFDADADGTVKGAGAGVVVLRRADRAARAGDPVRAILAGSAVNNDGADKAGFTAPSPSGQSAVIRRALADAGVAAAAVSYVEAHGTGTALGDALEAASLAELFGTTAAASAADGDDAAPAPLVGAVKGNIGHLDAAAGIAGLIKAVRVIETGWVPPSGGYAQPAADRPALRVAARLTPLDCRIGDEAVAGISSFGIGGTNAHAVLRGRPKAPDAASSGPRATGADDPPALLLLSAPTPAHLPDYGAAIGARVAAGDASLADIAHTLDRGRRRLPARAYAVGGRAGLVASLDRLGADAAAVPGAPPALVFFLPGQGGADLAQISRVHRAFAHYRCTVADLLATLDAGAAAPLRAAFEGGTDAAALASDTAMAQPLLFLHALAMADLLADHAVRPDRLVGQSLGEFTAAVLAGLADRAVALRLVIARGRLMAAAPAGAMLAVAADPAGVSGDRIAACRWVSRGPAAQGVLAGDADAVAAAAAGLAEAGVRCRRLAVAHAFHTPAMAGAAEAWAGLLAAERLSPPARPCLSNLTGDWLTAEQATDPAYWARQMVEPMALGDGLGRLADGRPVLGWDLGPGRAVAGQFAPIQADTLALSARDGDLRVGLLDRLGRLWCRGMPVAALGSADGQGRRKLALPGYPFRRQRHWPVGAETAAPLGGARGGALGQAVGAARSLAADPGDSGTAPAGAAGETGAVVRRWLWQRWSPGPAGAPGRSWLWLTERPLPVSWGVDPADCRPLDAASLRAALARATATAGTATDGSAAPLGLVIADPAPDAAFVARARAVLAAACTEPEPETEAELGASSPAPPRPLALVGAGFGGASVPPGQAGALAQAWVEAHPAPGLIVDMGAEASSGPLAPLLDSLANGAEDEGIAWAASVGGGWWRRWAVAGDAPADPKVALLVGLDGPVATRARAGSGPAADALTGGARSGSGALFLDWQGGLALTSGRRLDCAHPEALSAALAEAARTVGPPGAAFVNMAGLAAAGDAATPWVAALRAAGLPLAGLVLAEAAGA
ncbi:hypothetical protein CCR85_05995, partial [Rhodothalassium salexigens]|uniref:non-ribosomal peptide synthetase/type I polyketide synthase n=1 Tax=Rhodothalassium salexigens TaxID=1086 RepID=UPI001914A64C|nr:hypothetical protein [Rhodothalassium salexigens]